MDIKLLITDLDDTLISRDVGISQRALDAIEKINKKGIKATIATGRMHSSAFPYAMELDIDEPIISYNGALIKQAKSNDVISHLPVKYEYAQEVLQLAKDMKRYVQFYSQDEYYVSEHCAKSDMYGILTGVKAKAVGGDLSKHLDIAPTKLLIIGEDEQDGKKIYDMAAKEFEGRLNITRSSDTYVEFNNLKASKGSACAELAEYYGIKLENIMSLGNGGNDVDMIECCGLGIAVDNAVEEAKTAADYICPAQRDDGVAAAIEQFLLKR